MQYLKSPPQKPYELKVSFEWGGFVRYIEIGDDLFATRQVDEYENGYLTCYDREHWEDQFGALADFRYGETWRKHWGESDTFIESTLFEQKWGEAANSPPLTMRQPSADSPPPWIALFESGKWKGQP